MIMNKIEELIQHYCPNGVEYKTVGEVCEVLTGGEAPDDAIKGKDPIGDCIYPIYSNGVGENALWGYASSYRIDKVSVTFSSIGTIGYPTIRECYYTPIIRLKVIYPQNDSQLSVYYLKYALETVEFEKQKSSVPNINANMIKAISIPVPPLPVQEEIVRVLDTFTELQAELQAELQKRLQQYNYYRDNLLSFEGRTDVEWVTIEQLFHRKNGYTPSKANPDFWTNGTIPWFRMEDIRENGRILTNSIQKVHPSAVKKNSLVKAGSIILATSATIGEHALVNVDCLTNQRFTCLTVKEDYSHKVDIKFIFYYMFKVDEWCRTHTVQGNFPGVDMSLFPNVSIPLPTLDEQKRIASILDRFDALTTDLTAGLPAEIEKRKQQYEYYRDRLLTFKRAN